MSTLIHAFYDGYLKGGAVEGPTVAFIETLHRDTQATALEKTASKTAIYWGGISLTAATTVALSLTVSPYCAIGSLAAGFFANPLCQSVVEYAREMPVKLPAATYIKIGAVCLASLGLQAAVVGTTATYTSPLLASTTSLVISAVTVGSGVVFASRLCKPDEEMVVIQPQTPIMLECINIQRAIDVKRNEVEKLDGFIKIRPDLLIMTQELIQEYGEFISKMPPPPTIKIEGPNDYIGRRGNLMLELNRWNHELTERIEFIKRHGELYTCFESHVKADKERKASEGESGSSSSSSDDKQLTLLIAN